MNGWASGWIMDRRMMGGRMMGRWMANEVTLGNGVLLLISLNRDGI